MTSELHVHGGAARKKFMLWHELKLWRRGVRDIAGIDEAGRGPLAGPVVAAAVIFPPHFYLAEVNDSKQLSSSRREALFRQILAGARAVGVGVVAHDTIDRVNILNATYLAMHEAVRKLSVVPEYLLVDGNRFLDTGIPYATIVDGDASSFTIAAASIVAKVTRDWMMLEYDRQFPGYGFAQHKGYATVRHCEAIKKLGYCGIHRRSFSFRGSLG